MEKTWGADDPDLAQPLASLAWIYKARGEYERSRKLSQRALDLQVKALGPEHPAIADFQSELAQLYEAEGDIEQAVAAKLKVSDIRERNLTLMLSVGSERQKRLYVESLLYGINVAISLHLHSAPGNREATRLALTAILRRKGRSLDAMADQIGALRRHLDPRDAPLFDELSSKRARLAAMTYENEAQPAQTSARESLSELQAEIERLEAQIGPKSAAFRVQAAPVTLERVQQAIPSKAVLVEFVAYRFSNVKTGKPSELWGPERYAAYLLRRTGEPTFVDLGEAAPVNAAAGRFRASLSRPGSADVKGRRARWMSW
jgi:tetratricopeptide (TPR) repeat protein